MAQAFHSTGFQPYRRTSQAQDNQTVCGTEKHAIDPKLGRIARKVCREKGVEHPKMGKTPPKFLPFLTARLMLPIWDMRQIFLTTPVEPASDERPPYACSPYI